MIVAEKKELNPHMYSCTADVCAGHKIPGTGRHWHFALDDSGDRSPAFASRAVGEAAIKAFFEEADPLRATLMGLLAKISAIPATSDEDELEIGLLNHFAKKKAGEPVLVLVVSMSELVDVIHDHVGDAHNHDMIVAAITVEHEGRPYTLKHQTCRTHRQSLILLDDPILGPLVSENKGLATREEALALLRSVESPGINFPPSVMAEFLRRLPELFAESPPATVPPSEVNG